VPQDVDAPPTQEIQSAVTALVADELKGIDVANPHPLLPPATGPKWSPLLAHEHERIATNGQKEKGIDLSRYEALDPPSATGTAESQAAWQAALKSARASSVYLSWQETSLALLEKYGKNSWLIGNSQLEDILKSLETELRDARATLDQEETSRKAQQDAVAGELLGLEENWRKGVGRLIETEIAVETLKQEILAKKREAVS
jgi:pre-mRNA-splicing factor SPF27